MAAHRNFVVVIAMMPLLIACGRMEQSSRARPGDGAIIYQSTILTMDARRPAADAVIIANGVVVDIGPIDDLVQAYPGASFDERYLRRFLFPAFVDARERPKEFANLDIPCGGSLKAEDLLAASDQGPVRIVANGGKALASVIDAVKGAGAGTLQRRITVEAGADITPSAAREIVSIGASLIVLAGATEAGCISEAADDAAIDLTSAEISGRIALSLSPGDTNFLQAAGARLGPNSALRLSPRETLEAITIDAAYALGRDDALGSITPGKPALIVVLDRNPLATPGEAWGSISVEPLAPASGAKIQSD